jgi:hypothetical protein
VLASGTGSVVETIAALDAASRRPAIARYVQQRVAAVLGRPDAVAIPYTRGFFALGMDSLTSLELRNRLEKDLALPLPATVTLEYGSIELLAGYLAGVHPRWVIAAPSEGPAEAIAGLSEAELAELLSRELDR